MSWNWKKILGIETGEPLKESKITIRAESPQEKRYSVLLEKREHLKKVITEKGFSSEDIQDYRERLGGFTTDDMDVFEYAKACSELLGIPAVQVTLEPTTKMVDILTRLTSELNSPSIEETDHEEPRVKLFRLITKQQKKMTLCTLVDDAVGSHPANQDIKDFQNIARGLLQGGKINLVSYCSNIKAIPMELSINVTRIRPIK